MTTPDLVKEELLELIYKLQKEVQTLKRSPCVGCGCFSLHLRDGRSFSEY